MNAPPRRDEALGANEGSGETVQQGEQQQHRSAEPPPPQAPRRPWREVLKIHPAADLFPLMSKDELDELAADIKRGGLTSTIALCDDHETGETEILLDGRNRLDALELLGVELFDKKGHKVGPLMHAYVYRGFDPYAYVISANIRRRHLDSEQKRDLIAELLKATPDKSNNTIAKTIGVDDKTVGKVRSKLEATSEIPKLTKTVGKDGKARPAKKEKLTRRERQGLPPPLPPPPPGPPPPSAKAIAEALGIPQLAPIVERLEALGKWRPAERMPREEVRLAVDLHDALIWLPKSIRSQLQKEIDSIIGTVQDHARRPPAALCPNDLAVAMHRLRKLLATPAVEKPVEKASTLSSIAMPGDAALAEKRQEHEATMIKPADLDAKRILRELANMQQGDLTDPGWFAGQLHFHGSRLNPLKFKWKASP
jgi:hypothetical protein